MNKVLIIGGGIIGLSICRELIKKGISDITILERSNLGKESSYAAGGMLAVHAETNKPDDFFHLCRKSLELYQHFAEEIFAETGIDIELDKSGTLYLAFSKEDSEEINTRYDWQTKAGLKVEKLSPKEIHKFEPFISPDVLEGLFFPNDWQVENRKLLQALENFCRSNGVKLAEESEITEILFENGKIKGAKTNTKTFYADIVILATGAWTSLIKSPDFVLPKVKPIRGQMIEYRTAKRLFSKVIYSPRGYLIPRQNGRILVGATSVDSGFERKIVDWETDILQTNAFEIAPSLANLSIQEKWVGFRPFAADGFPVLGEITENLLIATAHYRNGILLAPITAKLIADKIAENIDSEYFRVFGVQRC